jgi:hypothetical protein
MPEDKPSFFLYGVTTISILRWQSGTSFLADLLLILIKKLINKK